MTKKNAGSASALFVAGMVAMAGADKVINPAPSTSAKISNVRFLADGKYALAMSTKIGANPGSREIVCDPAEPGIARLDGIKANDPAMLDACRATLIYGAKVNDSAAKMANRLVQ